MGDQIILPNFLGVFTKISNLLHVLVGAEGVSGKLPMVALKISTWVFMSPLMVYTRVMFTDFVAFLLQGNETISQPNSFESDFNVEELVVGGGLLGDFVRQLLVVCPNLPQPMHNIPSLSYIIF